MVKKNDAQNSGIWGDYNDVINRTVTFYELKKSECPKGVSLIHEKVSNKHYLSFRFNLNGKRIKKKTGEDFSEVGIVQSVIKANKIADVLSLIAKNKFAISDFDGWYDTEILGLSEKLNLLTYREIFKDIEDEYYKGTHHNNRKIQRSRDIPSFVASYQRQYGGYFAKFPDWDKIPSWPEIESVWNSYKVGSKDFYDIRTAIRAIVKRMPNGDALLQKISKVKAKQTNHREKQELGLDDFLTWYDSQILSLSAIKRKCDIAAKSKWLWVAGMCVMYGLRPSEIAASLNLDKSFSLEGETVYPLSDEKRNPEALLVIGEYTDFNTSTKTGMRVIAPIPDKALWDKLQIRNPMLPKYSPRPNSSAKVIVEGFEKNFRDRMASYKCPVTQLYAFRHLYSYLCELHGIDSQELSDRMGHTLHAHTKHYRQFEFKKQVNLRKKKGKSPLPLDIAIQRLQEMGIDIDTPDVKLILRVIYQID